jgi:hypothetical protein
VAWAEAWRPFEMADSGRLKWAGRWWRAGVDKRASEWRSELSYFGLWEAVIGLLLTFTEAGFGVSWGFAGTWPRTCGII